ncbi:MAG: site-specific integrase [Thaumarchaeota archaeon]|nr:site-specific integrase [Nitrososphaerota archaeon]
MINLDRFLSSEFDTRTRDRSTLAVERSNEPPLGVKQSRLDLQLPEPANRFLRNLETRSIFYQKNMRMLLQHFLAFQLAKGKNIDHFTRDDLNGFLKVKRKTCNDRSIKNYGCWLQVYSTFLWEESYLSRDEYDKICREVRKLKAPETKRMALTDQQQEVLFEKLCNMLYYRFLLFLGLNFGLRRIEYVRLKMEDIDLEAFQLLIRGKGKKNRSIAFNDEAAVTFRLFMELRATFSPSHDFVLFRIGRLDNPPDEAFISHSFVIISRITGVHVTPYSLRYTFGVRLWKEGLDIVTISRLFGHSKIDQTRSYMKIEEREFDERYRQHLKMRVTSQLL